MQHTQKMMMFLSGVSWSIGGIILTVKGIQKLLATHTVLSIPFFLLILSASLVGLIKGITALKKSATKIIIWIQKPAKNRHIFNAYPPFYYFLLPGMVILSVTTNSLPISPTISGWIKLTIGIALLRGSLFYIMTKNLYKKQIA